MSTISQEKALEQLTIALENARESGLLERMIQFGVQRHEIDSIVNATQNMIEQRNWFMSLSKVIRSLVDWE